ncbi:MAG: 30S ribosomal protein S12 methylthiotransferase RimO [Christensenellaceae bacterium]
MAAKIGVISLGCAKNRIDTEMMLSELSKDYEFVDDMSKADVVIINTCTFINDAKEESINTIIEVEQQKRIGNVKGIIVTGCMPQRYKEELKIELSRVDAFLGTAAYKDIKKAVSEVLAGHEYVNYANADLDEAYSERVITTIKPTAYVKIADGCDNNCSYCVIPSIRGRYQSRKMEDILNEIRKLVYDGYSEIILIAQDTTRYGVDIYGKLMLAQLMDCASQIAGVKWLRVLYSYPENITDELIAVMVKHENIVKYIDIPLQHMDNQILSAMNRRNTWESSLDVIKRIRDASKDFVIRSTVIVGFPGETRSHMNKLYLGIKQANLEHLGVFSYSQEEGTPAGEMENQVDEEEKEFRRDSVLNIQSAISLERNQAKIGMLCDALIEGYDEHSKMYYGRIYAQAPEVDGKVFVSTEKPLISGKYYQIKIMNAYTYDFVGELITAKADEMENN